MMEDGGYGFDRASRAPGEMSVLCLGRLFECSPFFSWDALCFVSDS